MADEASDEVRERIRADLRRAGLLPPELPAPPPLHPRHPPDPRRSVTGFFVGVIAPALVIIGLALLIMALDPR